MNRSKFIFFYFLLLTSCTNGLEKVKYYENGLVKSRIIESDSLRIEYEYYESGQLKVYKSYNKKNRNVIDQQFSSEGNLKSIRESIDSVFNGIYLTMSDSGGLSYYCNYILGKKMGDCVKYIDDTHIHYVRNFKRYKDEEYLNQDFEFGYNGNLLRENSTFVQMAANSSEGKTHIKFYVPRENLKKYEYQAILMHFRENEVYKIDTAYFNKNEYEHIYDDVLNDGDYIKVSFWLYTITDTVNDEIQLVGRNIFFTLGSIDEYNIDERFILD